MARFLFLLACLGFAIFSSARVINHDAVVGFSENMPAVFRKWKPALHVSTGCVPFPAVNRAGDTGGGLAPRGTPSGGCSKSTGQVYCRGHNFGNRFAMMYSWYMPKDLRTASATNLAGAHRHDWESIVIWLSRDSVDARVLGVAVSAHGGYTTYKLNEVPRNNWNGNQLRINYYTTGFANHELRLTSASGGQQPLIDWNALTSAARHALETTDFGSANVPFKTANFQNNLRKAWI